MARMHHRSQSVDLRRFGMIPRADIPRSSFRMQKSYKSTFDSGWLNPVFCEEVLPGDTFSVKMTAFARMATPIFPFMDNLHLESFFFFVPNRLVWDNWARFMGEQDTPGASISFLVPQIESPLGGYQLGGLADLFGLPTVGQVDAASNFEHSALPFRAYKLIWNEWFRDQNLQSSQTIDMDDGPDPFPETTNGGLLKRGKRHDYFTSALPWLQKWDPVYIPVGGGTVPVIPQPGAGYPMFKVGGVGSATLMNSAAGASPPVNLLGSPGAGTLYWDDAAPAGAGGTGLVADMTAQTMATINALRQSFQMQKLFERDARGGTRYTELVRSHFGVMSPDARLQRPEYLGGGRNPISVNPIAQTSETLTGTPLATLSAFATSLSHGHGFSASFTEHGYIIGLVNVRADLTYQQGLRRHWSRRSRYDFYFPVFAHLGEQAILSKEIYCTGEPADELVFGYQERWAEYKYMPSEITGLFRSTSAGTLDAWHLAQHFTDRPTLSAGFIVEDVPIQRVVAVQEGADQNEFLFDAFFDVKAGRPMPMYSVPGLVDHF